MDQSFLWGGQISATEPGGQAAATSMANAFGQIEQPPHGVQIQDQQALLTTITRRQEELQRMVAAQSVAQREINELLSSVAPAIQAGNTMDNQSGSGILGRAFDTKSTFTKVVPQNLAAPPGSNFQSHPVASADPTDACLLYTSDAADDM
eukprot:3925807-Rhodomonas_salina.1